MREEGSTTVASGNGQLLRGSNLLSSTFRGHLDARRPWGKGSCSSNDNSKSNGNSNNRSCRSCSRKCSCSLIVVVLVVVFMIIVIVVIVVVMVARNRSGSNVSELHAVIIKKTKHINLRVIISVDAC